MAGDSRSSTPRRRGGSLATLLALLSLLVSSVSAHGYLSVPPARNINDSCRQCLSAGGPSVVNANNQYKRGMCGNAYTDTVQSWNVPGVPQATYMEGSQIEVQVVITAHHIGYFDMQLCPSPDISDECFSTYRLMRAGCTDPNDRNCFRVWKTLASNEAGSWVVTANAPYNGGYTNAGTTVYKMRFQLPTGVSCSHCVLRWHYYTTNSCPPSNVGDAISSVSEEFFNCADISIVALSGNTVQTGPASDALKAALQSRYPTDLRAKGMGYQCPERGLGYDRDYLAPTAMSCWNEGTVASCTINGASPTTTSTTSTSTSTTVVPTTTTTSMSTSTVTPTTTSTSTTSTPNPTCAAPVGKAGTGNGALIGYWHNWNGGAPYPGKGYSGSAQYIRLPDVPLDYNVIQVSFITGDSTGRVSFTPGAQTVAAFQADMATAKAQGRKVGISVGGADNPIVVTAANKQVFIDSLKVVMDTFDFDGIDIDLEQGSVSGTDAASLADAMRQVRDYRRAKGKGCYLSMSPEFPYLRSGMYVTLGNLLINEWDYVSPQLYNQGGDGIWVNGVGYVSANADMAVFLREMYKAFVDSRYAQFGAVFSPNVFVLGLPATNWAAGTGYATPAQVSSAVTQLRQLGYNPRGLMDWSVNWDQTNCWAFVSNYRSLYSTTPTTTTTATPTSTTSTSTPTSTTTPTTTSTTTTQTTTTPQPTTTTSTATSTTTTTPTSTSTSTGSTCKCVANNKQATDAWCQAVSNGDPMQMCKAYAGYCVPSAGCVV